MKFTSISLVALTASTVLAGGGRKDHGTPTTTTVLANTEAKTHKYGRYDKTSRTHESSKTGASSTYKYGRFDKTKKPVTVTSFVPQSVIDASKSASRVAARSSSFYHGDVVFVGKEAVNGTGAGAANGTAGGAASNGTAGGAAGSNSTGGAGSSANAANAVSGYGFGVAGALIGAALLI